MSEAIKELIKKFGTQCKFAKEMGVSQQTVSLWLHAGKIPAKRILEIERLANWTIEKWLLNSDIFPPPIQ